MITRFVYGAFIAGLILPHDIVVGQRSSCETCFSLTPVVSLSTVDAPIVPSFAQSIVRTTDGRWLVSHLFGGPAQFAEYDSAGRFLGVRGKAGRGPGEFDGPPKLYRGPRRSIWAVDYHRLIRFDEHLKHIATTNLSGVSPSFTSVVVPGAVVMNGRSPDTEGHTYTVLMYDTSGALVRRLERQPTTDVVHSVIGPASGGGFWVLPANDVNLRRYSDRGELQQTIRLRMDHFRPWPGREAQQGSTGRETPPPPMHFALVDFGGERLAVLTRFPSRDWKPQRGPIRFDQDHPARGYETVITLLDLRTGQTLATRTFTDNFLQVEGAPDHFFSIVRDEFGEMFTTVYKLGIARR